MRLQALYRQVTFVFRRVPPTASRASPDLFRRVHTAPPVLMEQYLLCPKRRYKVGSPNGYDG
ncbi:hypothetical protein EV679_3540 [Kerstersia gyiorum]|uniref:Uncharacterized protein n=1 Tax=Kerstersia gyiorum TaxID=206506 RepID=A0A4Q7M941_9BURK|nr:hypothetical protein EV679_3540 [Kerstersia gyiorum]